MEAGEKHRVTEPVEVEPVEPISPPVPLLACKCCRETLPLGSFARNIKNTNRFQRARWCRACTAFRLRIRRQQDPERFRAKGRERRERHATNMTPERKAAAKLYRASESVRQSTNAAAARYKARQAGIPVLIQKAGRLPVFIKAVCRISEGCPLRPYCTIEGKGLA